MIFAMTDFRWGRYPAFCTIISLLTSACSFSPIVSQESIDYNRTVEDVTSNVLVTNVLRGRDQAPLSFSDLSQIRGSFTASFASQSVLPFGTRFGSTTRDTGTAGPLTLSSNPGFDIAPLNTKQFYLGILSSVSESTFAYYLQRGINPRWILDLFVSQIDTKTSVKEQFFKSGSDKREDQEAFFSILDRWTKAEARHRLKIVVSEHPAPFGPPTVVNAAQIIAAKAAGLKIEAREGGSSVQLQDISTRMTLCVPNIDDSGYVAVGLVSNSASKLNSTEKFQKSNADCVEKGKEADNPIQYQVHLRSVEGLFYYLGYLQSGRSVDRGLPFYIYDHPVENERFSVEYNGQFYHVKNLSESPLDVTVAILSILNDVVNINRDANDLPSTKTVAVAN